MPQVAGRCDTVLLVCVVAPVVCCRQMLEYTDSAVTRNASEKKINSLLDFISTSTDLDLLQVRHTAGLAGQGCAFGLGQSAMEHVTDAEQLQRLACHVFWVHAAADLVGRAQVRCAAAAVCMAVDAHLSNRSATLSVTHLHLITHTTVCWHACCCLLPAAGVL